MDSSFVDYYTILDISPSATGEEIRCAYRTMIRKHHPDLHQLNEESTRKSQLINLAYDILRSFRTRSDYDRAYRQYYATYQAPSPPRYEEFEVLVTITLHESYYGVTKIVSISRGDYPIDIPGGVDTGDVIEYEIDNGKILVKFEIEYDPLIQRVDDDLYINYEVSLFTSVLGGEINVNLFDRHIIIMVPAGTSSGDLLRLENLGMSTISDPDQRGDVLIRIMVRVPTNLSLEQRVKFQKLADLFND